MTITIRTCGELDWEPAIAILNRVYVGEGYTTPERAASVFRRDVISPGGDAFVATDSGRVVGIVVLLHLDSAIKQVAVAGEAEFRLLAVHPDARGRGVAELLVGECIRRAAEPPRSADRLVLWTQPTMSAAQRLYQRLGFRRATERDALLGPYPAPRWVYVRDL